MSSTWMSNIMKGTRVGSSPGKSVAKIKCWPGCAPKVGTPKTKKSPTRPGERVNNCDCG